MIDTLGLFDTHEKEYLKFDRIEDKLHESRELCALLLLSKFTPKKTAVICGADHDVIYLGADIDVIDRTGTEEDVIMMLRCGIDYSNAQDCLIMRV